MSPKKLGFLQATGVVAYIFLIGLFFSNANKILPNLNNTFGPMVFLLLFSTSAMICGLMVLYKPYRLFLHGKKKSAVNTVVSTAVWLFVFLLTFLVLMFVSMR